MNRPLFTILIILFCTLLFIPHVHGDEGDKEDDDINYEAVPRELAPAFEHLLSLAANSGPSDINTQYIERLMDFVSKNKQMKNTFSMGKRNGASSNYYEFSLNRSMKEVLDIMYNPDIPSHVTTPASIRRSEWLEVSGKKQKLPMLTAYMKDLAKPVMIKGIEFIENTPDTYSGAYYAYESDRALVLTQYKGQTVLISVSQQRDKSGVGKKGVVLGSDDEWNYIYTGEKGCTRSGLGWAETYMYDSASIAVYYEVSGNTPKVMCGMFKWLKAGWKGINMVKPHHIRDGVKRFAKPLKDIVESPLIADTAQLTRTLTNINKLPDQELRRKVRQYYLHLKARHQDQNRLASRWFDHLSGEDGHLAKMHPKEMKAFLEKAYVKHLLGKSPGIDSGLFTSLALNKPASGTSVSHHN